MNTTQFPKLISEIKGKMQSSYALVIFEDSEYIRIPVDLVYKYQLAKQTELDENKYTQILKEAKILRGKSFAHNYCSKSVRSEKEVSVALVRKGYKPDEIDEIIKFLKGFKLLDEENFARTAVEFYRNKRFYGHARIRLELLKKGISKEIIEKYLNTNEFSLDSELEMVEKIMSKKHRMIYSKQGEKRERYLLQLLKGKGLSPAAIRTVIEKVRLENGTEN